jgi:hypothetical protein
MTAAGMILAAQGYNVTAVVILRYSVAVGSGGRA